MQMTFERVPISSNSTVCEKLENRRLFAALVHQELHRPSMAVADFDRDGLDDVAICRADKVNGDAIAFSLDVLLNDGKGTMRYVGSPLEFDDSMGFAPELAAGDLDGDGIADLALKLWSTTDWPTPDGQTSNARIILFHGTGKGEFENSRRAIVPKHVFDTLDKKPSIPNDRGIAIGDVNGDGRADIVSWAGDSVITGLVSRQSSIDG